MASYPEDDGDWFSPKMRGFKWACCDCSLVHRLHFRINDGHLEMRTERNERATSAARRKLKRKVLIVDE